VTGMIESPMTMTHAEAIGMGAVEKYLLGHLDGDVRERFEAHFFGCADCAREVEALATFVGDLRAVVPPPSATPARAEVARPPRRWAPAAAAAGLLLASGALAYQTAVVVPALRGQVAAARAIQSTPQQFLRVARGADDVITLRRGEDRIALGLAVNEAHPFYRCQLLDARDQVLQESVVAAPAGGPLQRELQITLTVADRPAGEYVIAVGGQDVAGGPVRDVARFRFVLRREEE
jgi:hypothetical protein